LRRWILGLRAEICGTWSLVAGKRCRVVGLVDGISLPASQTDSEARAIGHRAWGMAWGRPISTMKTGVVPVFFVWLDGEGMRSCWSARWSC
jgi:hypothetical protein